MKKIYTRKDLIEIHKKCLAMEQAKKEQLTKQTKFTLKDLIKSALAIK